MRSAFPFIIAFLFVTQTAIAASWNCQDGTLWNNNGPIILTASADTRLDKDKKLGFGFIKIQNVEQGGFYYLDGINHRWNFGGHGGFSNPEFDYSFIIKPNGIGLYYDFLDADGKTVPPKQVFICRHADDVGNN